MNMELAKTTRPRERLIPNPKLKLREQFHEVMRFKHFSQRTEEAYWSWVMRFLRFHRIQNSGARSKNEDVLGGAPKTTGGAPVLPKFAWRHPKDLPVSAVSEFLSDLATRLKVAAATQNQAFNALLFLYREVLLLPVEEMDAVERVRRPARLPEVLSREDVRLVLSKVQPAHQLPLRLLYGTGMRLMELLRLRVKDVDFGRNQIMIRLGKGDKVA
jgi:integrase